MAGNFTYRSCIILVCINNNRQLFCHFFSFVHNIFFTDNSISWNILYIYISWMSNIINNCLDFFNRRRIFICCLAKVFKLYLYIILQKWNNVVKTFLYICNICFGFITNTLYLCYNSRRTDGFLKSSTIV